jgi:hypothetical protein
MQPVVPAVFATLCIVRSTSSAWFCGGRFPGNARDFVRRLGDTGGVIDEGIRHLLVLRYVEMDEMNAMRAHRSGGAEVPAFEQ